MVAFTFIFLFFLSLGIMMIVRYHSPEYQKMLAQRRAYPLSYTHPRPPMDPYLREHVKRRFLMSTLHGPAYGCAYCGREGSYNCGPDGHPWEIDHVVPYSRGGPTTASNLVLACRSCNQSKSANTWQVTYPNGAAIAAKHAVRHA